MSVQNVRYIQDVGELEVQLYLLPHPLPTESLVNPLSQLVR